MRIGPWCVASPAGFAVGGNSTLVLLRARRRLAALCKGYPIGEKGGRDGFRACTTCMLAPEQSMVLWTEGGVQVIQEQDCPRSMRSVGLCEVDTGGNAISPAPKYVQGTSPAHSCRSVPPPERRRSRPSPPSQHHEGFAPETAGKEGVHLTHGACVSCLAVCGLQGASWRRAQPGACATPCVMPATCAPSSARGTARRRRLGALRPPALMHTALATPRGTTPFCTRSRCARRTPSPRVGQ
jgi:hypothetical protein